MFIATNINSRNVRGNKVLNKADRDHNIVSMMTVLERCRVQMVSPRMMHFIVQVKFESLPEKLVQRIKEVYKSQFNKYEKERLKRSSGALRKRSCPDVEMIYSIESKMINQVKYDHIHFMFIVDFGHNRYSYREMISVINRTLGNLNFVIPVERKNDFSFIGFHGENSCGYLRYRDKNSSIIADDVLRTENNDFREVRGHDLKSEFQDAIIRASYLCKSEQKELLPDHIKQYSFGHTRAPRARKEMKLRLVA